MLTRGAARGGLEAAAAVRARAVPAARPRRRGFFASKKPQAEAEASPRLRDGGRDAARAREALRLSAHQAHPRCDTAQPLCVLIDALRTDDLAQLVAASPLAPRLPRTQVSLGQFEAESGNRPARAFVSP